MSLGAILWLIISVLFVIAIIGTIISEERASHRKAKRMNRMHRYNRF